MRVLHQPTILNRLWEEYCSYLLTYLLTYLFSYLFTYFLIYLLTYLLTYLLHGAESFLRS